MPSTSSLKTGEKTIEISEEHFLSLKKEEMLREMADTLEERLKKRLAVLLAVIAVLSFFGIQGIAALFINQQLSPQIEKAKDATAKINAESALVSRRSVELLKAAELAKADAKSALDLAREQSKEVKELMKILGERASSLDKRLLDVSNSSKILEERIKEQKRTLEKEFESMTVKTLLEANDKALDQYVDLAKEGQELSELQAEIERIEKEVLKKEDEFEMLSEKEKEEKGEDLSVQMFKLMLLVEQFNSRVEKYNTRISTLRDETESIRLPPENGGITENDKQ